MPNHAEPFFNVLDADVDLAGKIGLSFRQKMPRDAFDDGVVLAEKRGRENPERRWTGGCITSTAAWRTAVRLDDLAARLEQLEHTRSRLKMYDILGTLIKETRPEEISIIAYLCEGRLLPAYTGLEIGVGERLAASAIATAFGRTSQEIQRLFKRTGDLGNTAERLVRKKTSHITVTQTYRSLLSIARISGADSIHRKTAALAALLLEASPRGARYIVRFVLGRWRLGVGVTTLIEAAARTTENPEAARASVRPYLRPLAEAMDEFPHYGVAVVEKDALRLFTVNLGEIEEYRRPRIGMVEAIRRMMRSEHLAHVILAGSPQVTTKLRNTLAKRLGRMTVGTIDLSFNAEPAQRVHEEYREQHRVQ